MKQNEKKTRHLLDATLKRNVQWEIDESGLAVLIVPRFINPLAVKWLVPLLSKPTFRLKLDALGSFVWQQCDGVTPVSVIAENMRREFGDKAEPVHERVATFVSRLQREKFLVLEHNNDTL
jgi:hypothetical protein